MNHSNDSIDQLDSLSAMVAHAEVLKNRKEYLRAIKIYERAMELNPGDTFLIQRMALVTYKSRIPDSLHSLLAAQAILARLNPEDSIDPETLGLSGSINKKLFEETGKKIYFEKAFSFYNKGFQETDDYYNGINLAYLYLLKASMEEEADEAQVLFENANSTNKYIVSICAEVIASTDFAERNDKEFIYQTLAQAHLGLDQTREVIKLIPTINEVSKGSFDLDTFHKQNSKLIDALEKYKQRRN